jgi:ubiquitin C-terminal hydrolase
MPAEGLRNHGNTCYINALTQCLRTCEPLVRGMRPTECAHEGALWSALVGDTIPLARVAAERYGLPFGHQHDAAELFMCLLGAVRPGLAGTCRGLYVRSLTCSACGRARAWKEPCSVLSLAPGTPVQQALDEHTFVVQSGLDVCTRCGAPMAGLRAAMLVHPAVLVVHVDRSRRGRKDGRGVACGETLALDGATYALRGVVDHHGATPDSGHYTARVARRGGWVRANDAQVTACPSPATSDNRDAAMLFLVRTGAP